MEIGGVKSLTGGRLVAHQGRNLKSKDSQAQHIDAAEFATEKGK
jgi:hypothetical protein